MEEYMLPCTSKQLFGIECMGCGTQRAIALLLKGEFVKAFQVYPAIYTFILLFSLILLHLIDKNRNYTRFITIIAILNAFIMVVSYFYKLYF